MHAEIRTANSLWQIDTNSWEVIGHWFDELVKSWPEIKNYAIIIKMEIRA